MQLGGGVPSSCHSNDQSASFAALLRRMVAPPMSNRMDDCTSAWTNASFTNSIAKTSQPASQPASQSSIPPFPPQLFLRFDLRVCSPAHLFRANTGLPFGRAIWLALTYVDMTSVFFPEQQILCDKNARPAVLTTALINIRNLPATSWVRPMNDWLAECCNGNRLDEDLLDVQQCIGQAPSNSFPESSSGMIGKTWLQTGVMDGRIW